MADNTTAALNSTIATDDIGGVHYQRVKLVWGADGTATDVAATAAAAVPVDQQGLPFNWKTYADASFVTGDSPAVHDFNGDTGRNARIVRVWNDGAGAFTVAISTNGSTFGDEHTMTTGEELFIDGLSVDSIRITWGADSSYRILML